MNLQASLRLLLASTLVLCAYAVSPLGSDSIARADEEYEDGPDPDGPEGPLGPTWRDGHNLPGCPANPPNDTPVPNKCCAGGRTMFPAEKNAACQKPCSSGPCGVMTNTHMSWVDATCVPPTPTDPTTCVTQTVPNGSIAPPQFNCIPVPCGFMGWDTECLGGYSADQAGTTNMAPMKLCGSGLCTPRRYGQERHLGRGPRPSTVGGRVFFLVAMSVPSRSSTLEGGTRDFTISNRSALR